MGANVLGASHSPLYKWQAAAESFNGGFFADEVAKVLRNNERISATESALLTRMREMIGSIRRGKEMVRTGELTGIFGKDWRNYDRFSEIMKVIRPAESQDNFD